MMILSGCNDVSVQNQVYEHGNQLVADYVAEFNSTDEEIYVQMYDNSEAEQFLKDAGYLTDYAAYWCREKNDARRYSFPIAYSFLEFYKAHPDMEFIRKSYPGLKEIYAGWEGSHWDEEAGLFWQMDDRDGMEISISGALSGDMTGYRTTINSYMYADSAAL